MSNSFEGTQLSREALDNWATKYKADANSKNTLTYSLAIGGTIQIDKSKAMTDRLERILLLTWSNFSFSR
jgi:hypothetical protein